LTQRDIRLQYSGTLIFAAKMASVATGLIFQFMIARSLLPTHAEEYDLWFNINDLTAYFTLIAGVLPFWVMRAVTRDKQGAAKTGIVANLMISLVATLLYLVAVPFVLMALNISLAYLPVYFVVALQIVELHSLATLEACLQARIPRTIGYGLLVQQVGKVILGYVLIIQLNQLLLGAVVSTIVAFGIQIFYYFRLVWGELQEKIRLEYVKEWLKGSILNIYNVAGSQIAALIFIMLLEYGQEGARGRLGAATTIANVITYSSFLAYALYPKLLAERKSEDITTSLKLVLMFAVPLSTGAIALSDSYITILTDVYTDAAPVLVILAMDSFVITVAGLFSTILLGVERVDEEGKLSLRQLLKSRIFKAFSLPYVHAAIALPTAFYVLTNYTLNQPLQSTLSVSLINFVLRLALFFVLYAIVRNMIEIHIPWKNIAKYIFAAAVMGSILYLVPHPTRILTTLAETALGGLIYLGVLFAIDKEARTLPRTILQEMLNR